jgi:hypothetical protein
MLQIYVDLKRFSSLQLSSKEQFDTHIQKGKQISKGETFYNYLSNRKQCVKLGTALSTWQDIYKGVPQDQS